MNQYYVQWWTEFSYGVGIDGYANTVVIAKDSMEAKELVEERHGVQVSHIDVHWVKHPLEIKSA